MSYTTHNGDMQQALCGSVIIGLNTQPGLHKNTISKNQNNTSKYLLSQYRLSGFKSYLLVLLSQTDYCLVGFLSVKWIVIFSSEEMQG